MAGFSSRAHLAVLVGLLIVVPCRATVPYQVVERWTAADGLPTETVTGLVVDGDEQLWLASSDGVVRYQGFDFRHFHRGSDPALPRNRVMAIHAAPAHGVIVQFDDGHLGYLNETDYRPVGRADADHIAVFDSRVWFIDADTGVLFSWSVSKGLASREIGTLSALQVDAFTGRLLLGTHDGRVLALSPSSGSEPTLVALAERPVIGVAAGPKGQLFVLDSSGASAYLPRPALGTPIRRFNWEMTQTGVLRASWTQRGWLVANLFSEAGIGPHLVGNGEIERLPMLHPNAIDANRSPGRTEFLDAQGRRWINDGSQLFRDGQPVFQSLERISSFVVDPYGQLWVAQPRGGVRLLNQNAVSTFGRSPGELPDTNIYMVAEWNDQLLIANWAGLTRFDPAEDRWTRLLARAVTDILPAGDDLLVAGRGVCRLSSPGVCRDLDGFPVPDARVLLLHRDHQKALWAGTEEGLFRRDAQGRWSPEPLDGAIVRTVHEDGLGRLTFGTRGQGLVIVSASAGSDFRSALRIGPDEGLSSLYIRALHGLPDGSILVGTEDAGLCLLDRRRGIVGCLSTDDGLPHHSVHYMIVDDQDRLWVNTNSGIYRIALASLLPNFSGKGSGMTGIYRYGLRDGLPSVEGNGGVHRAGALTDDGRIWFPNQFGLVAIRPDLSNELGHRALTPRIRPLGDLGDDPIELSADSRHLELDLAAISLASPENVQFRYRFSSTGRWVTLGNQRHLVFRDLRPGRHLLEVDARHVNGPWSGRPAQLDFRAGYRLYEHPAFHAALALLLFGAALFGAVRARRRRRSLEIRIHETTDRLSLASEQVASLGESLRRVDVEHRSALQAISRELKDALNAAFHPLLEKRGRDSAAWENEGVRRQSLLLGALIDQISRFGDDPTGSESGAPAAEPTERLEDAPISSRRGDEAAELAESDNLVQMIRMEVLLHLADPDFSVEVLAGRLGMSRSVLYRRVSEYHGASPAELIRDIRLERAANLLIESDEQISTIAFSTGFRSVSAFSRAFTKKMGVSPRRWRDIHPDR